MTLNIGAAEPKAGNAVLNAQQVADVKAELWYINIHSTACSLGEIRGQLEVAPHLPSAAPWAIALSLLLGGLAGGWGALRRRAAS